jgi:hypothetical protein
MIKGLRPLLEKIEEWDEIASIIPARIKPTKAVQPGVRLTVQAQTPAGLKCLARSGTAVQEVFFVTHVPDALRTKIASLQ